MVTDGSVRMDRRLIAGTAVQAQPGDFYGGWVTDDIVSPFQATSTPWTGKVAAAKCCFPNKHETAPMAGHPPGWGTLQSEAFL